MLVTIKRFLLTLLAGFLTIWMLGCGTAGEPRDEATTGTTDTTTSSDGTTTPTTSTLTLLTSSPQLSSNGEESVTLTALARDSSQNVVTGVDVSFIIKPGSIGTIEVTSGTTDSSGTATALLKAKPNKENRKIIVYAKADSKTSNEVSVEVSGTALTVSGSTSAIANAEIELTIQLKDSSGNAIANETLEVSSDFGNSVNPTNPITDLNGQTTVKVTADSGKAGEDKISVSAYQGAATTTHGIFVSQDDKLFFSSPAAGAEINLTTNSTTIVAKWTDGSDVARTNRTITFSASRGTLAEDVANSDTVANDGAITVTTDGSSCSGANNVAGNACATISATTAGPSTLTATGTDDANNPVSAPSRTIEFVADSPASLTLQPSPASIGINSGTTTTEKSEVIALVRDAAFNVVKNQTVNFTLEDPTGGSISPTTAITDSFGMASTIYTAGATPSSAEGVKIIATLAGLDPVTARLTVADKSLFIVLGTGNTMEPKDLTKYSLPYTALVTDADGNPVSGVSLTISLLPKYYYKGYYEPLFDGDGDFYTYSPVYTLEDDTVNTPDYDESNGCRDEDRANHNGFMDDGEDYNNNGQLDPKITATIDPSGVTTDNIGFADFNIVYPENYAHWVKVELIATGVVGGTESRSSVDFLLPILDDDVTEEGNFPAGHPSPFGRGTSCANTF